MTYTSLSQKKPRKRSGGKRRRSAYKKLQKGYDVSTLRYVTDLDSISAIRESLGIRVKDIILDEARVDLDSGYIAKFGAYIYVQKHQDLYRVYSRELVKNKLIKKKINNFLQ